MSADPSAMPAMAPEERASSLAAEGGRASGRLVMLGDAVLEGDAVTDGD
jgi:hypothetical protein